MTRKIFLFTDKGGKYLIVNPDLEHGEFVPSSLQIKGTQLIPFGLSIHVQANGFGYSSPLNAGKSKDQVRIRTFANLIDQLSAEAENSDFFEDAYILVRIEKDSDYGTHWHLEADFQFLLYRQ